MNCLNWGQGADGSLPWGGTCVNSTGCGARRLICIRILAGSACKYLVPVSSRLSNRAIAQPQRIPLACVSVIIAPRAEIESFSSHTDGVRME